VLGIAIAASVPLMLWVARGTTFSIDALAWFMLAPGLDAETALQPQAGHLIVTTRVVTWLLLESFGSSQLPFLLLTIATVAALAAVFLAYASRRVGPLVALAPALVLVFFGSDFDHVATANGFAVLFPLVCGIGALLALERDDAAGDAIACALLCIAVATYTVGLVFVVAVAVLVLLADDRALRWWVFALPLALYAAWWVWSLGSAGDAESQITLSNVLVAPAWAFRSLSAALGALTGLDYDFGDEVSGVGPVLALLAIVALVWRTTRGAVPRGLWATLAAILVLWLMGALAANIVRIPEASRYLFPVVVGVLLVAAWALAGRPWSRGGLVLLYAVAAVAIAGNLAELRDRGSQLRTNHERLRAELTALELAGPEADPELDPATVLEGSSLLRYPFGVLRELGERPMERLAAAVERYGPVGFSIDELRGKQEATRARADAFLVGALGIGLEPASSTGECLEVEAEPGAGVRFQLPPGADVTLEPRGGGGAVAARRFAGETGVELGRLESGQAARLELPDDGLADGWQLSAPGTSLLVCEAA